MVSYSKPMPPSKQARLSKSEWTFNLQGLFMVKAFRWESRTVLLRDVGFLHVIRYTL